MAFLRIKKEDRFSSLLRQSFILVETGHFEDAVKNYYTLSETAKTKNTKEATESFLLFYDIMLLYLKTQEAKYFVSNKKFKELRLLLEDMKLLYARASELSNRRLASLDFLKREFEEYSRIYMYNFYKVQIVSKLKKIYSFLEMGIGDEAYFEYNEILKIYNIIVRYCTMEQRKNIYLQLLKLKEEIRLVELKERAYSIPPRVNFESVKFERPYVEIQRREFSGTPTQDFDSRFLEMHKYLKKNNLDGALRIYNQT